MINDRRENDKQLILMQQKLDNHINEFHNHINEFHEHCKNEDERWERFMATQESNTESIKLLVTSNKELSDSTRDVVNVWQAAYGTVKVLSAFGKFIKWLSGFAVVGVFIKWVLEYGS